MSFRAREHHVILYALGDLCWFLKKLIEDPSWFSTHPEALSRLQVLSDVMYSRLFDDNPDFVDGSETTL